MVIRGRGFSFHTRLRQFIHQMHLPEQTNDTFPATFHPDVDIAGLTTQRVGIEPGVRLTFQDGRATALVGKEPRQPRRLTVQQLVQAAYLFRIAQPGHRHTWRHLHPTRHGEEQSYE